MTPILLATAPSGPVEQLHQNRFSIIELNLVMAALPPVGERGAATRHRRQPAASGCRAFQARNSCL